MEPTGALSWYRSDLCTVLLEVVYVNGYLLDPGTYLFAFGLLERRKQDLSVLFCPGQCCLLVLRPLPGLDCEPVGILKSHFSF